MTIPRHSHLTQARPLSRHAANTKVGIFLFFDRLAVGLALGVIGAWRYGLAPLVQALIGAPSACRFEPGCSAYALEAVRRLGGLKGSALALKRIGRCHPWGASGHDPVPGSENAILPEPAILKDRQP